MTSIIHRCRSGLAWIAIVLLSACGGGGGGSGGGGGGGGGGGSGNPPTIIGTIIAFPAGQSPPGFFSGSNNSGVLAQVLDAITGVAISTATVTANGTTLPYDPSSQAYAAEMRIDPGAAVTIRVRVSGTTYTASGQQFSSYPTITAPTMGATWTTDVANLVSWTMTSPPSTSQFISGVVDPVSGDILWPAGDFLFLDSAQRNYTIGSGELSTGERWVLVGIADQIAFSGASSDSGFVLVGFNYSDITVQPPPVRLVSIATTPDSTSIGLGNSLQLTATGTYSDSTTADLTAQANWSTSDASAVTVDSTGRATAIAAGSATVTAEYGGFTAQTEVSVFVPDPSPTSPLGQAVTQQVDTAHSGHVSFGAGGPTFPPTASWQQTLNGRVSYPLIVGGRIYVTTNFNPDGQSYGGSLYALDEASGAIIYGPIALDGTYDFSGLAYDHDRVFIINFDGLLRAFDAQTGTLDWSKQMPNGPWYSAAPTALDGVVYVHGASQLFALDERNGNVLYTALASAGERTLPTVTGDGVYSADPCYVYKYDRYAATLLWQYSGTCAGAGSGKTGVYWNGRLYGRETGDTPRDLIFDAATGSQVGSFVSDRSPAFSGNTGFYVTTDGQGFGTLIAADLATGTTRWTFRGNDNIMMTPITIDNVVVIGVYPDRVYALDVDTGNVLWNATTPTTLVAPDEWNYIGPVTGFGAGDGWLVAPSDNVVNAWKLVP